MVIVAWLALHLERVPTRRHEPPAPEAQRNAYLALERFTGKMGGVLERRSDARFLDRLPVGGTLFLDRRRDRLLSPERLQRLLAWVSAGGYLIAVPESPEVPDPLLDALDVRRAEPPQPGARVAAVDVCWPADARARQIAGAWHLLRAGSRQPVWSAGSADHGQQLLHFSVGRGNLTIAAEFDRLLSNRSLGDHDHAELYWSLLEHYDASPRPQVWVLSRLQMPGLLAWIWEHARAACFSGIILILLWLWQIVPRFGPLRPESPPARRELREHLAAVGRYLWRADCLEALLAPARQRLYSCLALRQPTIAALPVAAQIGALADVTGKPAPRLAAALLGEAPSARAFTEAVRTLRDLEEDLRRRPAVPLSFRPR